MLSVCRVFQKQSTPKSPSMILVNSTMIKRLAGKMPKVYGLLKLSKAFKKPLLFTLHVEGEKLSSQMKGKCTDEMS